MIDVRVPSCFDFTKSLSQFLLTFVENYYLNSQVVYYLIHE